MYFIKHLPHTTQEITMKAHTSSNDKPKPQKGAALTELSATLKPKMGLPTMARW
jgi:hypothetical protein